MLGAAAGIAVLAGAVAAVLQLWSLILLATLALVWLAAARPAAALHLLCFCAAAIPHGMAAKHAMALRLASVPFHPLDLLLLLCLAGWAAAAVAHLMRAPALLAVFWRRHRKLLLPFLALMGMVLVGAGIGLLRANGVWNVARDLRSASYYLVFPVALLWVNTPRERRRVVLAILLGLLVFSLLCIAGTSTSLGEPLRKVVVEYWSGGQARFYFHNHYLLVFALPWVLFGVLRARSWPARLGSGALVVLFTAALLLSATRNLIVSTAGAAITAPLVLCLAVGCRRAASLLRGRVRVGSIVVILLAFGLSAGGWTLLTHHAATPIPTLSSRFSTLKNPARQDSSFRGRLVTYRDAFVDSLEAPVLGRGLGTLFRVPWSKLSYRPVHREGYQPVVDFLPLTVMGKSGLVGVLLVAWFGVALLRRHWRSLVEARSESAQLLLAVLFASSLWMGISSLLHTVLLTSLAIVPYAALFALAGVEAQADPAEDG